MSEHTPTPWHVELGGFIYSTSRRKVADVGFAPTEPERTANAYLLVHRVNLHEELVDTVSDLLASMPDCGCKDRQERLQDGDFCCEVMGTAKAATAVLEKARGGT